jgi:hypothetical protein
MNSAANNGIKFGSVVESKVSGLRGQVTLVRNGGHVIDLVCLKTGMPIRNLPAALVTLV